jgi:uncharacterized protein YjbI with pentapeptide repeats
MPRLIHDLGVFIATPSGLDAERKAFRETLEEHNELDPQGRSVIFTPIGWELTLGGHGRPQELINEDLMKCDYFILVLWDRWGSPTDNDGIFTSGCHEEFELAIRCLQDPSKPMREVIIFFKDVDEVRKQDPGPQLSKVLAFQEELEKSKKHLLMTFVDTSSFQSHLRRYLMRWANKHNIQAIEHKEILQRGVENWNSWRKSNMGINPQLAGANLRGLQLNKADLRDADLSMADMSDAMMLEADLSNAKLIEASFTRTNLFRANLCNSDLTGAVFAKTHLDKADFANAVFDSTILAKLDLSNVDGLDRTIHNAPSEIGFDTILRSKGSIPESFLLNCGVPENFITCMKSLTMDPIDYYSCFISYSHQDKSFAIRLHDQLQARGIRCWLDEHQMLPGDDIYEQVNRGIKLFDKVLLCCSEHSLTSWWVDNELATAFSKEQKLIKERGKRVLSLIPINLDGYMFSDEWKSGKRQQLTERLAADFTGWETDNDKFEEQFERVVKALQTEGAREEAPVSKL